ncbi:MAG: recombination regulator RecX [Blautia sp.]|nr:recombination regulator RecX [Lachnoclostridium sp.]MCM1210655.1 recombination regulator RecX [Blautia sp.]
MVISMLITEINAVTKSRYKIVLEDNLHFVLYKGELQRFHLQQGQEITDDAYQKIMREILPKRARLRCMNLLKSKDYTKKQLADKLREGGYPGAIIEDALAYVESYGYVDDERYVREFIEYHMQSKSRKRIENDLMKKGIDRKLISGAFEELQENGIEIDETAMISKILLKKNYKGETATDEEKRKMYGFLYRKGFHTERINQALLLDIT